MSLRCRLPRGRAALSGLFRAILIGSADLSEPGAIGGRTSLSMRVIRARDRILSSVTRHRQDARTDRVWPWVWL